jgi:hypothetical protein
LDLRIKGYGCLKFEGEGWAGRACAGANEKELTTLPKFGGRRLDGGGGRGSQCWGTNVGLVRGCRPLGLLELETTDLECFFGQKGPQSFRG